MMCLCARPGVFPGYSVHALSGYLLSFTIDVWPSEHEYPFLTASVVFFRSF